MSTVDRLLISTKDNPKLKFYLVNIYECNDFIIVSGALRVMISCASHIYKSYNLATWSHNV